MNPKINIFEMPQTEAEYLARQTLRAVNPRVVAGAMANFVFNIGFLGFEFLHAQHLRVDLIKPVPKAFVGGRTNAVGVKSHDAKHAVEFLFRGNRDNGNAVEF